MSRHYCRHCSDPIPHDGGSMCFPCSQLPVAERGRQPGGDDDLGELLEGIDEPDPAETETEQARRERLHAARCEHVKQSFERGRRVLLARALDPSNGWARIDH